MANSKQPTRRSTRISDDPAPDPPPRTRKQQKQMRRSGQPLRRSARLRGEPAPDIPLPARKRRRKSSRFPLLSLPDGTLLNIMSHLEASNTTGTIQEPRDAFSLALTNTRLMRLFREQLKRITPDDRWNLSSSHVISVIRLGGHNIREIHLPKTCFSVLKHIPSLCPRLEKLTLFDNNNGHFSADLPSALELPLRVLTIDSPAPSTLGVLNPLPEQLILIGVSRRRIPELIEILRNPPKKLFLRMKHCSSYKKPEFLASLREAIPKMEEISLDAVHMDDDGVEEEEGGFNADADLDLEEDIDPEFEDVVVDNADDMPEYFQSFVLEMEKMMTGAHRQADSKCKKMCLPGNMLALIEVAQPNTVIEVTKWEQTFAYNGYGVVWKTLEKPIGELAFV